MVTDRSYEVYRSALLSIVGLILIGANLPSQNSSSYTTAGQVDQNANQEKTVASGVSRIAETLEAQNAKTDPYEKERNKREIRNLAAQENSAYWTESMFWATVAALILSSIGIGLVWTTFRETQKANDIAKDSMYRQLKAYLTIESAEMEKFGWPEAHLIIHNSGSTPATNITVTSEKYSAGGDRKLVTENTQTNVLDIGGQSRRDQVVEWITGDRAAWIYGPERPTEIKGTLAYNAVVPNQHGTFERFEVPFSLKPLERKARPIEKLDLGPTSY